MTAYSIPAERAQLLLRKAAAGQSRGAVLRLPRPRPSFFNAKTQRRNDAVRVKAPVRSSFRRSRLIPVVLAKPRRPTWDSLRLCFFASKNDWPASGEDEPVNLGKKAYSLRAPSSGACSLSRVTRRVSLSVTSSRQP